MSKSIREFRVVKQTMQDETVQYSIEGSTLNDVWVNITTRWDLAEATRCVEQCRLKVIVEEEVLDV